MHWLYRVCNPAVRLMLFLLSRWEVKGKENIPREGAVLVVANHMTLLDPPLLSVSLGRYAQFMAKEELFQNRALSYLISGLGGFPVHRGRLDRQAMRVADRVLAEGGALVVFPEGRRSRSKQLQQASAGATLIALRSKVPVLPAGITGTERVSGIWSVFRRPRLTVSFGQPFHLPAASGKADRAECTRYIMEQLAGVLPPQYRGAYRGAQTE